MQKERGNGANVVIRNSVEEILVVRQNYGEKKYMLPGGEIERGESPRHAAQEETEEETDVIIDEKDMKFVGLFVQRPNGLVVLYETDKFTGTPRAEANKEILEARFMSYQEIIDRRNEFGLGYLRMIIRYKRCVRGLDCIPTEGRLADRVEYPKGLDVTFDGVVLQV